MTGVGGSVVCTSSPAAFVGFAGGDNAAYAASKGGISAMVRSLALDYASAGIRVNCVVPGATDTPLLTVAAPAEQRSELRNHIVELAREQVPLGRLGTPEEVAGARPVAVVGCSVICDRDRTSSSTAACSPRARTTSDVALERKDPRGARARRGRRSLDVRFWR